MQKNAWKICFNAYGVSHTTNNQQRWESPTYLTAFHANVSICFFLRCLYNMNTRNRLDPNFTFFFSRCWYFCPSKNKRLKSSGEKWTEQITECLDAVQFFRVAFTNEIHFRLLFTASGLESLKNGIVWIEMPFFSSFVLLQPYTTHFCTISLCITNSVVTGRNDQTAK